MRSIHVAEYYSAPKRKEILSHATIGTDFEGLLGEISQTQKDKCCIIPLLRGAQRVKLTEMESRWWLWAGGEGEGKFVLKGERVGSEDGGDGTRTV